MNETVVEPKTEKFCCFDFKENEKLKTTEVTDINNNSVSDKDKIIIPFKNVNNKLKKLFVDNNEFKTLYDDILLRKCDNKKFCNKFITNLKTSYDYLFWNIKLKHDDFNTFYKNLLIFLYFVYYHLNDNNVNILKIINETFNACEFSDDLKKHVFQFDPSNSNIKDQINPYNELSKLSGGKRRKTKSKKSKKRRKTIRRR